MTAKKEHQRILQRRQIIEDRKEQLEHLNDQRVGSIKTSLHALLLQLLFRSAFYSAKQT